ncbi:hypothetical protein PJWF_00029 [Achromobacter phage JWF]|uniref:hypothetical protein n=1 Tax=Achromobacter phage JWF TaxID=1589748 RepID=UPI000588E0B8|nr:hypothetical protein AXJ13_gp029 [Achromobacter phage JWF]AJD82923.1 hypothetical protein PJWF_00029 [Achromobacter phage JWF]
MLLHKSFVSPELVFSDDKEVAKANEWTLRVQPTPTGFIIQSAAYQLYWQFDHTKLQHGDDILHLVKARSGEVKMIWHSETTQSKDGMAAALQRNNIDVFMPLVVIAIAKDTSDFVAVFQANSTQTLGDFNVLPENLATARSDEIFLAVAPQMTDMINRYGEKMRLLKGIRTNDAIAALEAQVDLLTSWVSALIPEEFRDQLIEAGVLRNKDTKVVFDDMLAFKQSMRSRVGTYQKIVKKT